MSHAQPTTTSRRLKFALFAVLLIALACGAALFAYLRWRERPIPTVAGWHARVFKLAGDGAPGTRDDASAAQARFAEPFGVAVDQKGNVFVADAGAGNRIRRITPQGSVSTFAGGGEGFADGKGSVASFNTPSSLALDRVGNIYVADTGNNRIRKIAPDGTVTTLAGQGAAGYRDGRVSEAEFNGPVGVAVDEKENVYVTDTYNDRVRVVMPDGEVKTIAGAGSPGYADGDANAARFDTPSGIAVVSNGDLVVADTGNDRLRRITPGGQVSTVNLYDANRNAVELSSPVGLAVTHDNFIYVTEQSRGRVLQVAPDGTTRLIAGIAAGFADGDGVAAARFNQPAGLAVDRAGALYVADSANYLIRKLVNADQTREGEASTRDVRILPRLDAETLGIKQLPYPLDPQNSWHEVAATMGEARGSFDSTDSRDHLHAGIDVTGAYGAAVRAVFDEKVAGVISNWSFGSRNEGLRIGVFTYYHLRVGRDVNDKMYDDPRFAAVYDEQGKLARVRVRRGSRFRTGEALGTVNKMYHVHLNFGPPGNEINPLQLPLVGFSDKRAPQIARDGIQLFDADGNRLTGKRGGRLVVKGAVSIIVDAFDQVDGNAARRRLGLYKLGFQILRADGTPSPGFEEPHVGIEFDRLPPARDATKIAYAEKSGISVYSDAPTQFLYEVTNTVRHANAAEGKWDASELPPGDYILRVIAADFSGNVATANRDLQISIIR